MRIDKIEIDGFGKLNNFSLTLSDGFNLIYGENESGKSTLCDFLLSMFYEMPNDGKRMELSESFRRKYKPWNGERFGGRVYFTHEGKRYLLEKSFGSTKRLDRVRLLDADTWDECGSGENAGERFFGLGREGFLKTLFLKGLGADAKEMNSEEILTRLSNMETSGDEDVSYINIQNALEKEQHVILTKTGKGGKLYALKEQLQALELEKAAALRLYEQTKEDAQQAAQQQQEIKTLSAALEKMEAQHQTALAHERWLSQKKTAESRTILEERLAREKQKEAELKERLTAQAEKANSYISQTELDNAKILEKEIIILENKQEEAQKNRQICLENVQTKNIQNKRNAAMMALAVLAAFLLGGFVFKKVIDPRVFFGAGMLCSVALAVFMWRNNWNQGELSAAEEMLAGVSEELSKKKQQAEQLISTYGAEDFNAFFARAAEERASLGMKQNQEEQAKAVAAEIQTLQKAIADLPSSDIQPAEQATIEYKGESAGALAVRMQQQKSRLEQLTKSHYALSIDLAKQKGNERTISEIESDMSAVLGQIAFYEKRYAALEQASCWLSRAHGEIKQNYAPRLNQKTAEIFSRLTREKYSGVKLGEGFSLNYRNENNEIVDAAHLSGGTYDLLYVALRFAALSVLFDGAIPPVILDDALLQLDDGRFMEAADFLIAEEFGQVLYFTCHQSGVALFKNEAVNKISLSHTGGNNDELQN